MEALYHIKKAIEKDNTNLEYLQLYAIIHEKVGFTREAIIAYKKVIEIDQNDQDSWLDYSNLLFQQESKQEAINSLYEALEFNPENAKIYYRLSAYILEIEYQSVCFNALILIIELESGFAGKLKIFPYTTPELINIYFVLGWMFK